MAKEKENGTKKVRRRPRGKRGGRRKSKSGWDIPLTDVGRMSDSTLYGEDLSFADQLLEKLIEFEKRDKSHPEDALVLEPSSGWHRYIVHQAVLLFAKLCSFSVGEGARRRPVICFAAKFKNNGQENGHSNSASSRRRPNYAPPSSRVEAKKPVDERLAAQLTSRKNLLTAYSRVPELNPHAPSFVPVFNTNTNSSPHVPIMPVPQLNNLLNLQASSFTPRLPFPPELLSQLLPNTINSLPAPSPVALSSSPTVPIQRSTDLSQFVSTFKEFVPLSERKESFSPPDSIDEAPYSPPSQVQSPSSQTDSKPKVQRPAYVPPHLRNRKPEQPKPDQKRDLTEDEKDRLKNRERKEKAMALKNEEERPAYSSFKQDRKTRRNSFTKNPQSRMDMPRERSPVRSETPPSKPFTLADDYEFTSDEDLDRDWADDEIEDSVLEEISILGLNLKRSYDIVIPNYMLEIYDFPKSVRTRDLIAAFSTTYDGFSVRWIDDTHALAIFRSKNQCEEALARGGSGEFRVRELSKSSDVSRRKAASVAKEQRWEASSSAVRPEMNPAVAKRMIAANLDSVIAKQIRSAEREERALKGESSSPVQQKPSRSTSSHFVQNPLTVGGPQS